MWTVLVEVLIFGILLTITSTYFGYGIGIQKQMDIGAILNKNIDIIKEEVNKMGTGYTYELKKVYINDIKFKTTYIKYKLTVKYKGKPISKEKLSEIVQHIYNKLYK